MESIGKLATSDASVMQELYDAVRSLDTNNAFKYLMERVASRLKEIDIANRKRGSENQYTEAQAWSWLLALRSEANGKGEQKIIEVK